MFLRHFKFNINVLNYEWDEKNAFYMCLTFHHNACTMTFEKLKNICILIFKCNEENLCYTYYFITILALYPFFTRNF